MIIAPTVRHTGSQWLREALAQQYTEVSLRSEPETGTFMTDHTYDTHMPHFKRWVEAGAAIIIPLRHPRLVAQSWSKDRPELQKHWREMWQNLLLFHQKGAQYIQVTAAPTVFYFLTYDEATAHLFFKGGKVNPNPAPVNYDNIPEWEWLFDFPFIKETYEQ